MENSSKSASISDRPAWPSTWPSEETRDPKAGGFLRNHADGIAAMDLFVVPTISFRQLYGLLIVGYRRRQTLWFGVTAHPTAEWIANQITAACGWEQPARYLIRDRDGAHGEVFIRRRAVDRAGTFFVAQSWAGCITNMPGFNLRQAQRLCPDVTQM